LFRKLAIKAGMTPINFAIYFFNTGDPVADFYKGGKIKEDMFIKRGYFYGPNRKWVTSISGLDDYKIILMLRDPRDVLVSWYFAVAYSYSYNKRNVKQRLARRKEVLQKTIDEFVLGQAHEVLDTYTTYLEKLMDRSNVTFLKYEELVIDFESWLRRAIVLFDISDKEKVVKDLVNIHRKSFEVSSEDKFRHKRKVTPGDHKEKLKPETIQTLNSLFKEVLERLNYN